MTRRQLTLFILPHQAAEIEQIRKSYNPVQFGLIKSHVTLCKEYELEDWEKVEDNLHKHRLNRFSLSFGPPQRFSKGKGLMVEAVGDLNPFYNLRASILAGTNLDLYRQIPHITLIHPRNGTCTEDYYQIIKETLHPSSLDFHRVHLIEQINGGPWRILDEYPLT